MLPRPCMLYKVSVLLASGLLYRLAERRRGGSEHQILAKSDYMNVNKLPYEAPVADPFKLSAAPMDICVQFSGDADFDDFEEGEAL